MIECAILGDSIAVGVAARNPECRVQAVVGINSHDYSVRFSQNISANLALISIGSNDASDPRSAAAIRLMRDRLTADQVTWLLSPNNARTSDMVRRIARERGDRVIEVRPFVGQDGVHPTSAGYHRLSSIWRNR
jgi:lysophospholipase L1-like esterase